MSVTPLILITSIDGVPFAGGKKTGSTRHETRMAGTGAPDGGQDSGIEEENDSDQTRNNQHTQTSHGCIPRDREEDSGRTGGGVPRMGASRGVKTHFDQEGSRFNRRLHTLQAPVGKLVLLVGFCQIFVRFFNHLSVSWIFL